MADKNAKGDQAAFGRQAPDTDSNVMKEKGKAAEHPCIDYAAEYKRQTGKDFATVEYDVQWD